MVEHSIRNRAVAGSNPAIGFLIKLVDTSCVLASSADVLALNRHLYPCECGEVRKPHHPWLVAQLNITSRALPCRAFHSCTRRCKSAIPEGIVRDSALADARIGSWALTLALVLASVSIRFPRPRLVDHDPYGEGALALTLVDGCQPQCCWLVRSENLAMVAAST